MARRVIGKTIELNYSACLLVYPNAVLKVLTYTYKFRAFALPVNKLEGKLSSFLLEDG